MCVKHTSQKTFNSKKFQLFIIYMLTNFQLYYYYYYYWVVRNIVNRNLNDNYIILFGFSLSRLKNCLNVEIYLIFHTKF